MITTTSGLSRRKFVALAGTTALAAPLYMKASRASSGELNFLGWAGYDFKPAFEAFTAATGITVNFTEQPDQDAMAAQAKAAGGSGAYDISEPTADRTRNWFEQGFLDAWNTANIGFDNVEDGIRNGSAAKQSEIDGGIYGSPSVWGTEALAYNTDEVKLEYGTASLSDLWNPEYAGRLTVRPHSGLMTIGRWMDAEGLLPHPYDESYTDEAKMVANWDVILKKAIELKPAVAQWWKDENSAQGAFRQNGCVIGHCWDTTVVALQASGFPAGYLAPKEGAAAWLQNFVLMKGAKNVAQAEAWVKWVNSPEGALAWSAPYGASPVAKGAADAAPESLKNFLTAAFPGDALSKLWWWPEQTSWYVTKRNEYADQFQAA
jgi:spermidine/putrescine transport system substrate-binding protein